VSLIIYLLVVKSGLHVKGNNCDFSTTYGPRRFQNIEENYLSSLLQSLLEVTEKGEKRLKSMKKIMQETVFLTALAETTFLTA
jgi:hypothetical protein